MGYSAAWGIIGAKSCGGPLERERIWIACTDEEHGQKRLGYCKESAVFQRVRGKCPSFWLQAPSINFGVEHGLDSYVDQVGAIGNGQVPAVVKLAWEILSGQPPKEGE